MSDELAGVRTLQPDDDFDPGILRRERNSLMAFLAASTVDERPPSGPQIIPHLIYDDVAAAIAWLQRAFGFRERTEGRVLEPDRSIGHAELYADGAPIMLGPPSVHGHSPRQGVSAMLHVYVDDVDAHCQRARSAGATIVLEPADQPWGERRYQATDPEGHQWQFARRLR